ncbi:MAG: hypothetical protein KY476_16365 [Planctomycetes bacterium]|nr:hypothetical protein [Planctomycetota bacterium]
MSASRKTTPPGPPVVRGGSRDQDSDDELRLTAFRYIAGEMSDAESAAFEERLAVDQAPRETVAQMVAISQAVALLPAEPFVRPAVVDSRPCRRVPAVAWLGAGAVCLMLLAAVAIWNPLGRHTGAERNVTTSNDAPALVDAAAAEQLISVWSRSMPVLEGGETSSDDLELGAAELESIARGLGGSHHAAEDEDSDFSWMLSAVSADIAGGDPVPPEEPPQPN